MSETVQEVPAVKEAPVVEAPKKSASKQAKVVEPKVAEGKGRIEKVGHPSGDFIIEHL